MNVEFDDCYVVAGRCGKRPEVSSPSEFSAWERPRGMSRFRDDRCNH